MRVASRSRRSSASSTRGSRVVTVGTPVTFPNFDTVRHHVYSFSPTKTFELKLYAGVPNVPVRVRQARHRRARLQHPRSDGRLDRRGRHALFYGADRRRRQGPHRQRSPAGNYRLRVWHPGLPGTTDGVVSPITVGANDIDQSVRLKIERQPAGAELVNAFVRLMQRSLDGAHRRAVPRTAAGGAGRRFRRHSRQPVEPCAPRAAGPPRRRRPRAAEPAERSGRRS